MHFGRTKQFRIDVHILLPIKLHALEGQLDETSNLAELAKRIEDRAIIDLERLSFINSLGVREWCRLLRALHKRRVVVRLTRCSEAIIQQINMIVEAKGHAEVESFFAPFGCATCDLEGSLCIEVEPNLAMLQNMQVPKVKCPDCRDITMEFRAIPEMYLLFLQDKAAA